MNEFSQIKPGNIVKTIGVVAAFVFLYATVLAKLGRDWWFDENYSHGLLVPFIIALIVWKEWPGLKNAARTGAVWLGGLISMFAVLLLIAGVLGVELFTTRISLVLMLAGAIVYLFGTKILRFLTVPLALLLLAIPIPQIIFNRIAFPLQIWASRMAVWGIRLFDVPSLRKGNVIEILPAGATQTISLEVVGACSGIRSLMTLVTLALVLGYFTRRYEGRGLANLSPADLWRTIFLMISALPIAVLTNAARVTATGILTYHFGRQATENTWHELSGWLVYVVALGLLLGANHLLGRIIRGGPSDLEGCDDASLRETMGPGAPILPLIALMILSGIAVTWLASRGEADVPHRPLGELAPDLGDWHQIGSEIKFDESVEAVLGASDYTMREYTLPDGRIGNIYVGYYASQRAGATYHSPQNCLPGAGWVMKDAHYVEIATADGHTILANQYIVENGPYNEVLIYWYQGRGRTEASEYRDKLNTVWDSITRRRSDGAIIRVMTGVGTDEPAAVTAAVDLSARLADTLSPFVPE